MVGVLQLQFVLDPPEMKTRFPSAIENFEMAYERAVQAWEKKGWEGYWESMFHLGEALHYVGDMAMVDHTYDSNFKNHTAYEDSADEKGDPAEFPEFHAMEGGKYELLEEEPWKFLYFLAQETHQQEIKDLVDKGKFEWPLKKAIPSAERYTAALIAKFFSDVGVSPEGNPVKGFIFARGGRPLPGAYLFYKEARKGGRWAWIRSNHKGEYQANLIHNAEYWLRAAMPEYVFEGVDVSEFEKGNYAVVKESFFQTDKNFFLKPLSLNKFAEAKPSPSSDKEQMDASKALKAGVPILPVNQWAIGHGYSSQPHPGFVTNGIAEKANRALLSIYPETDVQGVEKGWTGLPESTLVTIQLSVLANMKTGDIIQTPEALDAAVKLAKAGVKAPADKLAWNKISALVSKKKIIDSSGEQKTVVNLIGAENLHTGPFGDTSLLLRNGIVPVIPKGGVKIEVKIMELEYLAGVPNTIIVTSDDTGHAYLRVHAGSNPGPITLQARVVENPTALQVEPRAMTQVMVHPAENKLDSEPPVFPSLSSSAFLRETMVPEKRTGGYAVTFENGTVKGVTSKAGPSSLSPFSGEWEELWQPVGDIVLGYNPIEREILIYATDHSSGDIYRYVGRWEKIGGPGAKFVADHTGHLYGLSTDKSSVHEFTGMPGKWKKIGGAASEIYAGGDKLYATNPDTGDIYRYTRSSGKWEKTGGPGSMFTVDRSGRLYGLSLDKSSIHEFTGTPGKWRKVGDAASEIYAGGDKLYATNPATGDIYKYTRSSGKWERIGGPSKMFAVGFQGLVVGLSRDGREMYMYTEAQGKWTKIGGPAIRIAAGTNRVYAVSPDSRLLRVRKLRAEDVVSGHLLGDENIVESTKTEEASGYTTAPSGLNFGKGDLVAVRGDVHDANTGRKIVGRVDVYAADKMIGYTNVINGHFKLFDLDYGKYVLRFVQYKGNLTAKTEFSISADRPFRKVVLMAR
ncbi:tectonin domain-containing protein [Acidobacteriota bacterium]